MNWTDFRTQFLVVDSWVFLDHAAVAPLPRASVQAIELYAKSMAENGVADVRRWIGRVADVRKLAAKLINAPNVDDIYFIPNTTHGIGVIAEGFPWRSGDNVVVPAEEYPSNQYPWMNLVERGVEVRTVPSRGNQLQIDDIRTAIDTRTRVLTISMVEFASGFRNDLDKIGELCRDRGIFFFVDAIQGLGVFPLDVQRTPIDALAADGHKWLLGPEGAGIGYISRDWIDRLHPIGVGANSVLDSFAFTKIDFRMKPNAGRWEGGAYNIPGITALGESLKLLLDAGIENIRDRVIELTDYLCENCSRSGLAVFSSRELGEKSSIISLTHPIHSADFHQKKCREAKVIVANRGNRLRVSPHAYNSFEEIDRMIEAVK